MKERLAKPDFDEADIRRINKDVASILRSGWLTTGKYAASLEAKFCSVVGTQEAVAVNSGTAALHVMMAFLHLKSQDEVVVPANTFASTANAVMYEGAKPVLADCDPDSFNVTAETVEPRINGRTKAVVVTHIGGNPCEMDGLRDLCERRGVELFEDAAHAIGSKYRGESCGSLSRGGAFSLYPTKVTTSAEGGVITTDDLDLANFARLYRNVGRKNLGAGPIEILGHNYRMSDVHAAIGLSQMGHLARFVKRRNQLAAEYSSELKGVKWIVPQTITPNSTSSFYCYIVRVLPAAGLTRDQMMERLAEGGIETTVMFRPVDSQPYFREFKGVKCPVARGVGDETLCLPLHTAMTTRDVKYVVGAIREAAR